MSYSSRPRLLLLLCIFSRIAHKMHSTSLLLFIGSTSVVLADEVNLPLSDKIQAIADAHQTPVAFNRSVVNQYSAVAKKAILSDTANLTTALNTLLANTPLTYSINSAGITIFLAPSPPPAQQQQAQRLEEVTVVGEIQSIATQRLDDEYERSLTLAQQLKQARTQESEYLIGAMLKALPAENLAESMQVFSGLNISRDRGEGLSINALGLGAEFQQTLLNGRRIANTENVRNSTQQGTLYRYDTLSAGVFSAVELIKSADVTMPSGAIGAIANIQGDDPLLFSNNGITFKSGASWLKGESSVQPGFTLSSHWRNQAGTLGVLSTLSFQKRTQRQYQYETWNWGLNGGALDIYHYDNLADDVLVPTGGAALTIENEDRSRLSHYLGLHWQPSSSNSWQLRWLYSDTNFDFDEHRLGLNPLSEYAEEGSVNAGNKALESVRFIQADVKSSREISGLNYLHNTWQVDGQLLYNLSGYALSVSPFVSISRAGSDTTTPITRLQVALQPVDLSFAQQPRALTEFKLDSAPIDTSQFAAVTRVSQRQLAVDNSVDEIGFSVSLSPPHLRWQIDTGYLYSRLAHDYFRQDISIDKAALLALDVHNRYWYTSLPNQFEASFTGNVNSDWLLPSKTLLQPFASDLVFGELQENDKLNSYQVQVRSHEWYANINGYFGDVTWVSGIRLSSTISESNGYGVITASDNTTLSPVNTRSHYHYWLPATSANWQIAEQWQWRGSISKTIARPNYADLNPKLHINSSGLPYAEGGNPYLTPISALNITTSINYSGESLNGSAMVFAKHLDDYIISRESRLSYNGLDYSLLSPSNNNNASVKGIELSATHAFATGPVLTDNLLSGSITLVDHQGRYVDNGHTYRFPIEGASKVSGNLRWVWGIDGLQGAININYRSDYLEDKDTSNNADIWVDAFTSVDASLAYSLENVKLRLDIYNLFNEVKARYGKSGDASVLMKLEEYGTRVSMSVQIKL